MENEKGYIYAINGPVVTAKGDCSFSMLEMVYVGKQRLVGEVIKVSDDGATVQVYEETSGLKVGEPIDKTNQPMSVLLGPGILKSIFDGIERPLNVLEKKSGAFIATGLNVSSLDEEKKWDVTITCTEGEELSSGQVYATCPETASVLHKCMVPNGVQGRVTKVMPNGLYSIHDTVVELEDETGNKTNLTLCQKWPIRNPRPVKERLELCMPLITGQRVIDSLFPVAKGGAVAIPGGFGTGKTMTQHQLAKWSDADIIVYVGCGERGNEMTQVLEEFSQLIDPRTGAALTDRTVLIANTSNMPVAAREASIYTGITLAEYYRDMGYNVAIMADSTSRWAEALREISGRLEEMPAEEGFPAYLPSRIAEFYERAGYVDALCGDKGSVTIIGAVSPAGSDFSEPVTQNTKRFTRCFWGLDKNLAYQRHYPAIHWMNSYTEYFDDLIPWYRENVSPEFPNCRGRIMNLLQEEDKLQQIVKLIGADVLPEDQKLIMEISRLIRVGFLQQNAFHAVDTYVPIQKQLRMMQVILHLYDRGMDLVRKSIPLSQLKETGIFEDIMKIKYDVKNEELDKMDSYQQRIDTLTDEILKNNE